MGEDLEGGGNGTLGILFQESWDCSKNEFLHWKNGRLGEERADLGLNYLSPRSFYLYHDCSLKGQRSSLSRAWSDLTIRVPTVSRKWWLVIHLSVGRCGCNSTNPPLTNLNADRACAQSMYPEVGGWRIKPSLGTNTGKTLTMSQCCVPTPNTTLHYDSQGYQYTLRTLTSTNIFSQL